MNRILFIILLLSFFIRIVFVFVKGDFENPEMKEHGFIARNLSDGYGYSMHWPYRAIDNERHQLKQKPPEYEGAFIPPLNPYFIYIHFLIFGDNPTAYTILMIWNAFFGTIAVYLSYLIAKILFSDKAAIIAGLLSAVYLPAIYGTITFSGSQLYHMLALGAIYFLIKFVKYSKSSDYIVGGFLCGLQTLVRSEFFALSIILIGTTFIIHYLQFKKSDSFAKMLVALVAFTLLIAPWVHRNYKLYNEFIPVVTHPWHEIWRGNNTFALGGARNADGHYVWLDGNNDYSVANRLDSLPLNQRFELAADSIFKDEVIKYWKEQPERSLKNAFLRVISLWSIDYTSPEIHNPVYIFFVLIVIPPAFYTFYHFIKRNGIIGNPIIIPLLFCLFYTALIFAVNFIIRYQIYFLTVLLPVSALGLEQFLNFLKSLNKKFLPD